MNKQDIEDFKQDFELSILEKKLQFTNIPVVKDFYVRKKQEYSKQTKARHKRLLNDFKHFQQLEYVEDDGEKLFQVLTNINFLKPAQYATILEFLKQGSLIKTSRVLGQNFNTTKATYSQAIVRLRVLVGDDYG